jgi:hypothetical protein
MNCRTVVVAFRVFSSFSSGTLGPTGISAGSEVEHARQPGLQLLHCHVVAAVLPCLQQ